MPFKRNVLYWKEIKRKINNDLQYLAFSWFVGAHLDPSPFRVFKSSFNLLLLLSHFPFLPKTCLSPIPTFKLRPPPSMHTHNFSALSRVTQCVRVRVIVETARAVVKHVQCCSHTACQIGLRIYSTCLASAPDVLYFAMLSRNFGNWTINQSIFAWCQWWCRHHINLRALFLQVREDLATIGFLRRSSKQSKSHVIARLIFDDLVLETRCNCITKYFFLSPALSHYWWQTAMTVPTNKICRRASTVQRPRTRSCHKRYVWPKRA